jgi:hypothetical protein
MPGQGDVVLRSAELRRGMRSEEAVVVVVAVLGRWMHFCLPAAAPGEGAEAKRRVVMLLLLEGVSPPHKTSSPTRTAMLLPPLPLPLPLPLLRVLFFEVLLLTSRGGGSWWRFWCLSTALRVFDLHVLNVVNVVDVVVANDNGDGEGRGWLESLTALEEEEVVDENKEEEEDKEEEGARL